MARAGTLAAGRGPSPLPFPCPCRRTSALLEVQGHEEGGGGALRPFRGSGLTGVRALAQIRGGRAAAELLPRPAGLPTGRADFPDRRIRHSRGLIREEAVPCGQPWGRRAVAVAGVQAA